MAIDDFLFKSEGRQGDDAKAVEGFLSKKRKRVLKALSAAVLGIGLVLGIGSFLGGKKSSHAEIERGKIAQEDTLLNSNYLELSKVYSNYKLILGDLRYKRKNLDAFSKYFNHAEDLEKANRFRAGFDYMNNHYFDLEDRLTVLDRLFFAGKNANISPGDLAASFCGISRSLHGFVNMDSIMGLRKGFTETVRGEKYSEDPLSHEISDPAEANEEIQVVSSNLQKGSILNPVGQETLKSYNLKIKSQRITTNLDLLLSWLEAYSSVLEFDREFDYGGKSYTPPVCENGLAADLGYTQEEGHTPNEINAINSFLSTNETSDYYSKKCKQERNSARTQWHRMPLNNEVGLELKEVNRLIEFYRSYGDDSKCWVSQQLAEYFAVSDLPAEK